MRKLDSIIKTLDKIRILDGKPKADLLCRHDDKSWTPLCCRFEDPNFEARLSNDGGEDTEGEASYAVI